jgi:hypothetical protein
MANDLLIQWLDSSGWVTVRRVDEGMDANGDLIYRWMEEVANNFPGRRVRTVDENGYTTGHGVIQNDRHR